MHRLTRIAPAALLLATASLRADITLPVPVPPQADAQVARVLRGAQVAIELRAHYGGSSPLRFVIVRPPEHGRLSGLRGLGDNRARIFYIHDGSPADASDGFAYVVQAGDRTSSPAEVRIAIEEAPPRLEVPGPIAFEEIVAGGSTTRQFPITNAGGGVLEGNLTVSSPWLIAPRTYRVAAGAKETVTLAFRPNEAKNFVGQVTVTGETGGSSTVALSGNARPALRVAPSPLILGRSPRREMDSLTNLTDSPMTLNFQTSANLQPIAEIALAAREERKVAVEVRVAVAGPIQETVTIIGPRFILPLPIEAPALLPAAPAPKKAELPANVSPIPAATVAASRAPLTVASSAWSPAAAAPTPTANPVVKVTAHRLASGRWELQWPAAKISDATYRIEERFLSLDGAGELRTAWRALSAAKVNSRADPVTAETGELRARELHMLRVTALTRDGTKLWESPPVALAPVPTSSSAREFWLVILGSALAIFVILRWRANHVSRAPHPGAGFRPRPGRA